LLFFVPLKGQEKGRFIHELELTGVSDSKVRKKLKKKLLSVRDSLDFVKEINTWTDAKQASGFLEYECTIKRVVQDQYLIQIHEGPHYYYSSISLEGINAQYPQRLGINRLVEKEAGVNWGDLELRLKGCLDLYQNEGYPFAAFEQLQVNYEAKTGDRIGVAITYNFTPGPLVIIDSIRIQGKIREKPVFVESLSGVSKGDIYRQKALNDIPRVLNNSIYYENVKEPQVKFRADNKVNLILELEPKETSKLDILLGILPPTDNTQRLEFTGSIDVALLSALKRG